MDYNAAFAGSFQGSSNDQFRLGNIRSNAELKGVNRLEDINLTLHSRPASGVYPNASSQHSMGFRQPNFKSKAGRKLQTTKKRGARDTLSARRAIDGFGPGVRSFRPNDQEIHEGIEKFQAMLARYPVKPKSQKAGYSLANKNLAKVYGKIQQQRGLPIPQAYEFGVPMASRPMSNKQSLHPPDPILG